MSMHSYFFCLWITFNTTCVSSWCEKCIEDVHCGYCFNDFGSGAVNGSCLPTNGDDSSHAIGKYCHSVSIKLCISRRAT